MFIPNNRFKDPAHVAAVPGKIRAKFSTIYTRYRKEPDPQARAEKLQANRQKHLAKMLKSYEKYVGKQEYVGPEKYEFQKLWKIVTRTRLFFEKWAAAPLLACAAFFEKAEGGYLSWKIMDTPLKDYAFPIPINPEEYLALKIVEAARNGRKLRILDVGMGTGKQWAAFIEKYGESVEFVGTVLEKSAVVAAVQECAVESRADSLGKNLAEHGEFDIVLTHCGMHLQELTGLKEIYGLLSSGGEVLAVGFPTLPLPRTLKAECPNFEILGRFGRVAYHLRKKAA